MLWFTAAPPVVMLCLGFAWGPEAALFFAVQAWMAFTLLEAVNCMQHYVDSPQLPTGYPGDAASRARAAALVLRDGPPPPGLSRDLP